MLPRLGLDIPQDSFGRVIHVRLCGSLGSACSRTWLQLQGTVKGVSDSHLGTKIATKGGSLGGWAIL
jgi:hypothetical protein